jgi:hypothetical protein
MKTYWDEFNEKYGKYCINKSLTTILEAFWYYCNGNEKKTKKILK